MRGFIAAFRDEPWFEAELLITGWVTKHEWGTFTMNYPPPPFLYPISMLPEDMVAVCVPKQQEDL